MACPIEAAIVYRQRISHAEGRDERHEREASIQTLIQKGIALHYRDDGPKDGLPVLLCNSLGTDLRIWDGMIAEMPEDLRVIRMDKRGHGLSDCPEGPYDIDQLADDALALLDALDIPRVVLVGLSIGGMIGQSIAARAPGRLHGLVLMDTAARIGTPELWQERIDLARQGGLEAMAEAVMMRWFGPEFRADPACVSVWRNMLLRTPVEGYAACCAALGQADYTASTAALEMPVMAIVGELDNATPPELVAKTAALCNAPCHVISGAGHLPCIDQPEASARLINSFIKEIRP